MESDRVNRWLTLGANIGVLAGIVLLIFELSQNREMMRAQTRNEISDRLVDIQMTIASNPQLADVLYRARIGEELSGGERTQFNQRNAALYRYWENVHYQYRLGLYDDSEYLKQRDAWRSYVNSSKAVADVWCRNRDEFSVEFEKEVNQLLEKQHCQ
jgi:hypothetical protein